MLSFFESALMVTAVAINGILAGISIERSIIELPAWSSVNLSGFHDYSLAADLDRGLIFYPAIEVIAAALVIAAAVAGAAAGLSFNGLMLLYVSAVLSVLHSLITTRAAPNMLSLRNKALNKDEVKARFDRFKKWQDRRATLQLLTFLSILLAFAAFV